MIPFQTSRLSGSESVFVFRYQTRPLLRCFVLCLRPSRIFRRQKGCFVFRLRLRRFLRCCLCFLLRFESCPLSRRFFLRF